MSKEIIVITNDILICQLMRLEQKERGSKNGIKISHCVNSEKSIHELFITRGKPQKDDLFYEYHKANR